MTYPLVSETPFSFTVPESTTGLHLQAWQLVLEPGATYTFPNGMPAGFLGIAWRGEVCSFLPSEEPCDPVGSVGWSGPIESETTLKTAGDEPAVILVVGIVGDSVPTFGDELHPRGKTVLALAPVPNNYLTAFITFLKLDQPDTPVAADYWPRPCFVLTSVDGPTPVIYSKDPGDAEISPLRGRISQTSLATDDLDIYLVKVPGGTWLGFQDGPVKDDGSREMSAIVCDFLADGDEHPLRILGCSWRCHGVQE